MRRKVITVLLALTMASTILGGCGAPKETSGRAQGTESAESGKNQKDSGNEGGLFGFLGGEETVKLVRPEDFSLAAWDECEYDNSGNMTKRERYWNGSLDSWEEYEYDDSGNMTKEEHYGTGSPYREEYEYDNSGNMTKKEIYGVSLLVNSQGILFRMDAIGGYDEFGGYEEYEYDDSGNMTRMEVHDSDSKLLSWEEYEYDNSGNMTQTKRDDESGSKYESDKSGNMTKVTALNGKDWSEYEYDKSGNMTKRASFYVGRDGSEKMDMFFEYEYDKSGNCIKTSRYEKISE